ncbi:hypothetical protein [Nitrincola tapanii]|uniref:hypothetical protein n=1 Tax=Nitrincola tapanii TaxID=1708751 RepID=UPI00190F6EC0|nr:hypothetical protein [Nitrincola tapanii]
MKQLQAEQLAQIQNADVHFGDLTLLVGPQASGKSVFLQLFKLVQDHGPITKTLKRFGYSYDQGPDTDGDPLLTLMFGEGMGAIWRQESVVKADGKAVDLSGLRKGNGKDQESVFFIPAQRVLTLDQGRPRNFDSFAALDPFVVKSFSEHLRQLMEKGLGGKDNQLFPIKSRLKEVLRDRIDDSIFHGATVTQEVHDLKKRIVINVGGATLPYMAWSAGQREFMPLLFSLYWLMPSAGTPRRKGVDWVVISTHSPLLLEAVWAIRMLQSNQGTGAYQKGLQALKASDRSQIKPGNTRLCLGSADIDSLDAFTGWPAIRSLLPKAANRPEPPPRWV